MIDNKKLESAFRMLTSFGYCSGCMDNPRGFRTCEKDCIGRSCYDMIITPIRELVEEKIGKRVE